MLGLTSDGTRHRPVHRGVWLSETILNKTPPPPPANVDPIEPVPPEGDKVTVRQRLEAHAKQHELRVLPRETSTPWALPGINTMPSGNGANASTSRKARVKTLWSTPPAPCRMARTFKNASEFQLLLLKDRDQVARAFIEHLCTYALRRVLTLDDEDDLQAIRKEAKEK